MDRGQTTMDFAVGISLFLLVLVGVFAFLPSVFAPFSADGGASMVVADRSANHLVGTVLVASSASPSVLDETCTAGFFDAGAPPADCNYDTEDLPDALAYDDRQWQLNVTIVDGSGTRTLDGTPLRAGPAVPGSGDVVTATRVVLLDGTQHRVTVRVW